jgi:hypothetical protein
MTDTYKPLSDDGNSTSSSNSSFESSQPSEVGRAILAGIVGGLASAAGYVIYTRLPPEQKDKLHQQVRQVAESRLNELRSRFNI